MHRRRLLTLAAGLAGALLAAGAASADAASAKAVVDAAKAQGLVGEQADGFLAFVRPANDPALTAAVAEINAGRAQLYREAAARNGVTPAAAGAAAFTQVVQSKLRPGDYYRTPEGAWLKK